jgi:hypothetical protein
VARPPEPKTNFKTAGGPRLDHGTVTMARSANRTASPATRTRDFCQWIATACEAIEKARCLEIGYEGFVRIVEVHRLGIGPAGEHLISGWQLRGPANERMGWKLINLDEPLSLVLTDIPSRAPRPDYRRGAKQFIGIICQL